MFQHHIVVNQRGVAMKMRGFNRNFKVVPKQNGAEIISAALPEERKGGVNYKSKS